jgi:hypothetical protein
VLTSEGETALDLAKRLGGREEMVVLLNGE